jgi:hypothetical protein
VWCEYISFVSHHRWYLDVVVSTAMTDGARAGGMDACRSRWCDIPGSIAGEGERLIAAILTPDNETDFERPLLEFDGLNI